MIELTPKTRETLVNSLKLAGEWYVNCQNTEENPWGGVHESADLGRYLYEYFPARRWCRGMGVWGQALAIMALFGAERVEPQGTIGNRKSATLAAGYLKSLQILDESRPRSHGAFCEHTPQSAWSYPRDAATGAMGLVALFKETGEVEYLVRAKLFCKWYHDYGSDQNGWPHMHYDLQKGEAVEHADWVPGDWQAGGGLAYYYLYKVTGEKVWLDYFRQLIDPLVEMYERNATGTVKPGFHCEVEISYGNDDFAIIALMCAYREWRQARMLTALQTHIRRLWTIADEDGTYPSFEGTMVCTINNHEYLKLCVEENLQEDMAGLKGRILKSTLKSLAQQETRSQDMLAYGGFYGETGYGVSRDRISHRAAGYAMIMLERVLGAEVPYYSSWGWENR